MSIIDSLKWRYATKKFDPTKKVSAGDLEVLKESIQLSASSYGLQLYKVLVIEDQATKDKLTPASWNQTQVSDAAQVLVFCNYTKVEPADIDEFLQLKSEATGATMEQLAGYGDFMKNTIGGMDDATVAAWTAKQTYIALGNLMAAAGELQIDTCPMEGFQAEQYNEILGLNERNLNAAVVCTVGYRHEEDANQHAPKTRRSKEQLFETV